MTYVCFIRIENYTLSIHSICCQQLNVFFFQNIECFIDTRYLRNREQRQHYHSCGTSIHLRPFTRKVTFSSSSVVYIASFLHVTFSRALRTAIIAGRPNTKVFYDVAHPDRGRGCRRDGRNGRDTKRKAIRLSQRRGKRRERSGSREERKTTGGEMGNDVERCG